MELQNLVLVFNRGLSRILTCKRRKAPYQGLFNLVGLPVMAISSISLNTPYT